MLKRPAMVLAFLLACDPAPELDVVCEEEIEVDGETTFAPDPSLCPESLVCAWRIHGYYMCSMSCRTNTQCPGRRICMTDGYCQSYIDLL